MQRIIDALEKINHDQNDVVKQTAYSEVYKIARVVIYPFLRKRIQGNDLEDILSMSLTKIILKIHSYNHNLSFDAWAKTIARNTLIDFLRMNNRQQVNFEFRTEESITNNFDIKNLLDLIKRKISLLPERERRVLEMRFFDNKSCKEVSQELLIPFGTVLTITHRFRQSIKSMQHLAA